MTIHLQVRLLQWEDTVLMKISKYSYIKFLNLKKQFFLILEYVFGFKILFQFTGLF